MITGSIVALVTPMLRENLEVDWDRLKRLVEWHIEQGTHAIVAVGTTGESPTLDVQEHMATIAAIVEDAAGRIPVIAGTGANSTREAIEWTLRAQQAGADACLLGQLKTVLLAGNDKLNCVDAKLLAQQTDGQVSLPTHCTQ